MDCSMFDVIREMSVRLFNSVPEDISGKISKVPLQFFPILVATNASMNTFVNYTVFPPLIDDKFATSCNNSQSVYGKSYFKMN